MTDNQTGGRVRVETGWSLSSEPVSGVEMKISRKASYAVRALAYLARNEEKSRERFLVAEVSAAVDIPRSFLAKIFQDLSKSRIVNSRRGAGGGFYLSRSASEITMRDVVESLEGEIAVRDCIADSQACDYEGNCSLKSVWMEAQEKFLDVLAGKTIGELADSPGKWREVPNESKRG